MLHLCHTTWLSFLLWWWFVSVHWSYSLWISYSLGHCLWVLLFGFALRRWREPFLALSGDQTLHRAGVGWWEIWLPFGGKVRAELHLVMQRTPQREQQHPRCRLCHRIPQWVAAVGSERTAAATGVTLYLSHFKDSIYLRARGEKCFQDNNRF